MVATDKIVTFCTVTNDMHMKRLFEKSRAKAAEVPTYYVRRIHEDIAWDAFVCVYIREVIKTDKNKK